MSLAEYSVTHLTRIGRFEPYREAWHLLTRKSQRAKQAVIEGDSLESSPEGTHLGTAEQPVNG